MCRRIRRRRPELALALAVVALGCGREVERGAPDRSGAPESSATPAGSVVPHKTLALTGYASVGPPAGAGQFVLAPSWSSVEGFARNESHAPPFVFTGAWVEVPGPEQSLIRTLTRQRLLMPNAFIIGIGSGTSAALGDIVLTNRAGAGLARAIVIAADPPTAPRAMYLTDPRGADAAEVVEQLVPSTFRRLSDGDVGTSVACLEGGRRVARVVVGKAGERLLGFAFGGALVLADRSDCERILLVSRAEAGARVYVPIVGVYRPGKVTRKDARSGRVWVSYDFAGKQSEAAFSFGDVADELAP